MLTVEHVFMSRTIWPKKSQVKYRSLTILISRPPSGFSILLCDYILRSISQRLAESKHKKAAYSKFRSIFRWDPVSDLNPQFAVHTIISARAAIR